MPAHYYMTFALLEQQALISTGRLHSIIFVASQQSDIVGMLL